MPLRMMPVMVVALAVCGVGTARAGAAPAGAGLAGAGRSDDEHRTRVLHFDPDNPVSSWVETPPPPSGTPEGDLHLIRVLIRDEAYRKALSAVKRFVKTYGEAHPLYPEALLARAQAYVGRGDYNRAGDVLTAFLNEFGGMVITGEALRLQFIIAEAYFAGHKRKFWGMRIRSGEDVALKIMDEISIDYPESLLAEPAIKTKADYLFRKGEHALAELDYSRILTEFPRSRYYQYALRRTADSALASHAGIDYDAAALIEAQERFREYRVRYPGDASREGVDAILITIREQRGEKDFLIADYYERTEHLSSAIYYYRNIVSTWPDTVAATKSRQRLELLGAMNDVATATAPRRP